MQSNIVKTFTCPACNHGLWLKLEKCLTDVNISTRLVSKTNYHGVQVYNMFL